VFFGNDYIRSGKQMVMYTYSTSHLMPKDKVRFYYALKGRDGKSGIVKTYRILHVAKTVLIVEERYDQDISDFLKRWNLPFTRRKLIVDNEVTRGGLP
jgi:hypothetical protein